MDYVFGLDLQFWHENDVSKIVVVRWQEKNGRCL
jgi:deoxyinosine 3'endonuclease (endonuclease V)